jgi:uncharacterized protein
MSYSEKTGTFVATPEKGEVSSLLLHPDGAKWLLVLGHGAGANMRHRNLQAIAENLYDAQIATFRYQFPYMERGGGGRDSQAVSLATVRAAVQAGSQAAPRLRLLAGGHSFGGRMTSLAAAETPLANVEGLVFCSFPLHQPGKANIERAAHLPTIGIPMIFLSGSRDAMAQLDQLEPLCADLGHLTTLHLLDTADHGFKILKRSRQSKEDVFAEIARIVAEWTLKIAS